VTASRAELASASSLASSVVTGDGHVAEHLPRDVYHENMEDVKSERGDEASASAPLSAPPTRLASPEGEADGWTASLTSTAAVAASPRRVSAPGADREAPKPDLQISHFSNAMQQTADPALQASPAHDEQTHSGDPNHAATAHATEREAWIAAAAADAMTPEEQERVALERQLRSIQGKVDASQQLFAEAVPVFVSNLSEAATRWV